MRAAQNAAVAQGRFFASGLLLLVAFLAAGLSCARALHSEAAGFNPASVQAPSCQSGNHNCGFTPLSGAEATLIEPADSFYIRPRGLPAEFDLTDLLPPVGNQGQQNSCLGWSLGYGLKSYYEKIDRGWEYDPPAGGGRGRHVFSPAFIYNQINGGEDQGATPREALRLMIRRGASPWAFMPYREDDFKASPPAEARSQALAFRSENFRRVSCADTDAIKTELYRGNPVMMGVRAHLNFYQLGKKVWENHEGRFFGGHAVLLSGYDDDKDSALGYEGAFRIYNSFGTEWGDSGLGWIAYDFLPRACLGAYVLHEGGGSPAFMQILQRGAKEKNAGLKLSAPTGVKVSRGAFAKHVELDWRPVPDVIAYRVERDDGEGFQTLAVVDEPRYRDEAVRPRIAYSYRIVSIGENGDSDPGRAKQGYAREYKKGERPGPVWNLRGDRTSKFVQLDWTRAQGAREHEIARWDEKRGAFRIIFKRGRSRYRDRRPARNTVNYYRVRAVSRAGKGAWSDTVAVRVPGPNVAPGAVPGLRVSPGQEPGRIELDWVKVTDARRYRVRRVNPRGETAEFFSKTNRFVDSSTEVKTGELMRYFVNAEGRGGAGPAAGPVLGRTTMRSREKNAAGGPVVHIPPPPGIKVKREPARKRILLSWGPVQGAAEYRVYRKRGHGGDFVPIGTVRAPGTSFSAPLFGGPGTLYFYAVRSRTADGVESDSSRFVSGLVRPRSAEPRAVYPYNGGLREFTGRWSAFAWQQGEPENWELFVAYSGRKFQATILSDGRRRARFSGDYIARDRVLRTDGFRMELEAGDRPAAARVFLQAAGLASAGKEIVFVRDVR